MGGESTFSKGDRVDRFEIRELIGEGGMGAIYRAVDTRIGRAVALKVVRADRVGGSTGEQARQRFLREALAMSKVDHRNVVRVLDFGFSDDTPYLAMEYLRGRDLGKVVKASLGPLPIAEVVDVMLAVCAAVRACHDAGIIHRDLKPSNVFLCESDSERLVKILDFGVSKPPVAGTLTHEGQILGTPQYLAPEQVDGKALPQTDQYAIGVMLYLCLTKVLPYQNHASLGLLRAIVVGKFTPPRELRADLPEKLEAAILRAMRVAPEERFESVHALGRELWEFASPEAREQWRAYYFDDVLRAPAKASTHAMPLIEAMARGMAAAPAGRVDSVAFAPTVTAPPTPATPAKSSSTPEPAKPASTADEKSTAARPKRRGVAPLVAAGVVVLAAAAGWLALRRSDGGDPPRAAEPVAPAPPVTPAAPAASAPAVATPVHEVQEPPVTHAAPARSPTEERTPRPASSKRAQKRHRRNDRAASSEQTADGVPIMP